MAHADDKIVSIRAAFGMWGVGTYWTLVERAAEQMTVKNPKPTASLLVPELCSFLGCKRNKLVSFLDHLQNVRGMKYKLNGDVLEITVSKLLEIKDNYQKDLEETSKRLPSKEVEGEEEADKEKEEDSPSLVLDQWNSFALEAGLAKCLKITGKRKSAVLARARESEFDLHKIFEAIRGSPFLLGDNDRGWKADFDFVFCSANNYLKILEGKYANSARGGAKHSGSKAGGATTGDDLARSLEGLKKLRAKERGEVAGADSGADSGG